MFYLMKGGKLMYSDVMIDAATSVLDVLDWAEQGKIMFVPVDADDVLYGLTDFIAIEDGFTFTDFILLLLNYPLLQQLNRFAWEYITRLPVGWEARKDGAYTHIGVVKVTASWRPSRTISPHTQIRCFGVPEYHTLLRQINDCELTYIYLEKHGSVYVGVEWVKMLGAPVFTIPDIYLGGVYGDTEIRFIDMLEQMFDNFSICHPDQLAGRHAEFLGEDIPNKETLDAIEEIDNEGGEVFKSTDALFYDLEKDD